MHKSRFHYAWHIAWAGMLCIFACLGLGRFALGMLLPAMGKSLALNYAQMGLVGTVNFIGYLVSVLACGPLSERFGYRRVIFSALLVIGISMMLISRSASFNLLMVLYFLTGMGSGAANVPMMALVSSWFAPGKRGKGTGFVVIGSGFAILLSGWMIPLINSANGPEGWRMSWLVLGVITVTVSFICFLVLRDDPRDKGLRPYGQPAGSPEMSAEAGNTGSVSAADEKRTGRSNLGAIIQMAALYFLFGYTYVIYATFIVTSLIQDRGFSETAAGGFWSWIGLLSIVSGPVFGGLSDRIGRKWSLALVFLIQSVAYLLAALPLSGFFIYLSIGCYGIVAWSVPSIMAALVGDVVGPQRAARVFGLITFVFAMGQIAGPAVAGLLAEHSGSFHSSFLMAAGFALVAVVLSVAFRNRGGCC
ncbi:MAG: YbfB/YjiJ family MFS transporter [Deltaproteobacteria bacterium]|nr:YbfB/YjiJ family MFS transporter [Deltaproteobacteria bacterium]